MTKEDAKKLYPIIQAFSEGKTIEYYNPIEHKWETVEDPAFGGNVKDYRVKPQPTYRPFKDAEECWNEMQKHQPFGWLKDIYSGFEPRWRYLVEKLIDDDFFITDGDRYSWSEGFIRYTFADEEPFGVKEEEQ